MGVLFEFICKNCGYKAEISGDKDCGQRFTTITVLCDTCSELYDIKLDVEPEILFNPAWIPSELYCPKSKDHSVKVWKNPGSCPKCGKIMEKGRGVLEWD